MNCGGGMPLCAARPANRVQCVSGLPRQQSGLSVSASDIHNVSPGLTRAIPRKAPAVAVGVEVGRGVA